MGGEGVRNWGKFYVIAVLFIAAVVLVTSGTMAFYTSSSSLTALLHTAAFTLKVNESTNNTQTLSDMTLAPGDVRTRAIKIDTSGLETASVVTVILTVHTSGDLPSGLVVFLDGTPATGTGTLTATRTIDDAQDQIINMTVSASWTTEEGEDLEPYRDLSLSYEVSVVADQKAGS